MTASGQLMRCDHKNTKMLAPLMVNLCEGSCGLYIAHPWLTQLFNGNHISMASICQALLQVKWESITCENRCMANYVKRNETKGTTKTTFNNE